ncbi:MAG: peptide ABC transporter substrate-binding protein [Cycloclasticus sp.]|nr:MAG: peptide ABC transporter substrate-binding protein [Cycloclasticus sp.]
MYKSFIKKSAGFALSSALLLSQIGTVQAFSFHNGDLKGALDTDLTYAIAARTEDSDHNKEGAYGNRIFKDAGDVFSHAIRGSSTLTLEYGDFGMLARGNYFYDYVYDNENLADQAHDKLARDFSLTDLMFYGYFGDNDQINIRLGKQVISWGENTFIQGSINDINTVDLNKLRQPGRALKDAFIGTNAAYISWNIGDEWTVESFYLFEFDQIQLDPSGSFFTTLDAVGAGGGFDSAGNGVLGENAGPFGSPAGACIAPDGLDDCGLVGGSLVRVGDNFAKGGQYGLAIRKFFPGLFNGSELAIYYQSLHDHVPMISTYYNTGTFFLDYVENIERLGVSFNTNIEGWVIAGEYHVRKDAPIQMTAPVLNGLGAGPFFGVNCGTCVQGDEIKGYELVDRHQLQVTFQRIWGVNEWLGADGNSTLMEVAYGWIDGLPDKNEALIGPFRTVFTPQVTEHFWGFQIKQAITYEAALFNVASVSPFVAFKYDVEGVSNEIVPLFVDDRKALTLGVNFGYGGGKITGGVSWTMFDGAEAMVNQAGSRLNGRTDRDFVQANVSYSF